MKKKSLITVGSLLMVSGLVVAGCSQSPDTEPVPPEPITEQEGEAAPTPAPDADAAGAVSAAQAIDVALAEVPGVVVGAELEGETGAQLWEVDVVDTAGAGTQLHIVDGKVDKKSEFTPDSDELKKHDVLAKEAVEIAEKTAKGVTVEINLDTENGLLVWEAELSDADGVTYELDIDAMTGDVIK